MSTTTPERRPSPEVSIIGLPRAPISSTWSPVASLAVGLVVLVVIGLAALLGGPR